MSATMVRQAGRVQLEPYDMPLALNMAKMAKGGFSRATIEETQYQITKPRTKVWEEQKREVEFPGHNNVKSAMERHPAMLCENQTDGCLPCQNGTARNPQTRWRCKGVGAPQPDGLRLPTPELTRHALGTPPVPPGYVYIDISLPSA
jgi:hypothetical protein